MPTSFDHSPQGLTLGTTPVTIYGPVAAGRTAVVFSGTFPNVDVTSKVSHTLTLRRYNGATSQDILRDIPVPYGGASKCPKMVLQAGESLVAFADADGVIAASVEAMIRS